MTLRTSESRQRGASCWTLLTPALALRWVIPWAEDDPGLTAPELWLNRTLLHAADAIKYGCGGLSEALSEPESSGCVIARHCCMPSLAPLAAAVMIHWRTRMTSPQIGAALAVAVSTELKGCG